MARRGLGQVQPFSGPSDMTLGQKCIHHHQEVEVKAGQVDFIHR